jgi:hypothetical protein
MIPRLINRIIDFENDKLDDDEIVGLGLAVWGAL